MNDHEPEFSDELISAYLDGELSPEEQAVVEEQLMDSLEHRRMFEELRALRNGLQELPQERLDNGFAERVLQRAEREIQVGAAGEPDVADSDESTPNSADLASSPASRVRDDQDAGVLRGLVWAVAAMAAAIALIVFNPLADRDVAVVDENANQARESAPTDSAVADEGVVADEVLAKGAKDAGIDSGGKSGLAEPKVDFVDADRKAPGGGSLNAAPQPVIANAGEQPAGRAGNLSLKTANAAADAESSQLNRDALELGPPVEPQLSAADAIDRAAQRLAAAAPAGGAPMVAPPRPADVAMPENKLDAGIRSATRARRNEIPNFQALGDRRDGVGPALGGENLRIVQVDLPADALASHFIDQKLRERGIAIETAQADFEKSSLKDNQGGAAARRAERQKENKRSVEQEVLKQLSSKIAEGQPASVDGIDYLYVVATADQVEALLADLEISGSDNREVLAESQRTSGGALGRTVATTKPRPPQAPERASAFGGGLQQAGVGGGQGAANGDLGGQIRGATADKTPSREIKSQFAHRSNENRSFARRLATSPQRKSEELSKAKVEKSRQQQGQGGKPEVDAVADAISVDKDAADVKTKKNSNGGNVAALSDAGEGAPEPGAVANSPTEAVVNSAPAETTTADSAAAGSTAAETAEEDKPALKAEAQKQAKAGKATEWVRLLLVVRAVPPARFDPKAAATSEVELDPAADVQLRDLQPSDAAQE